MTELRHIVNGSLLYGLARLTGRLSRFQQDGEAHLEAALATGRPLVLAAWHGMTMMLVSALTARLDPGRMVLLMPDDWRGAALAVFARRMGAVPFPMDLTGAGGMAAARRLAVLVGRVRQGAHCYITPDGPEGPAYVVKPGVAYIAQKAGGLILPLGAYARHGYRLPRWDQYVIPLPLSRISIAVGAPLEVPPGDDLAAAAETLTNRLHRIAAQAAANYYERG